MTTIESVYEQLDLFSHAEKQTAPPNNGTPTSMLAALQAAPKVKGQKLRILAYIAEMGDYGSIQNQASRALDIPENTVHPRFSELADDHLIETTLNVRNTVYGKAARVYVITAKGLAVLAESAPAANEVADLSRT